MCKIRMQSYRLNTAPITATVVKHFVKRFLYRERKKWPVHVILQILTHNCHFFLRYNIYVRTHLKVTVNVFNAKGLPSQVLNRTETKSHHNGDLTNLYYGSWITHNQSNCFTTDLCAKDYIHADDPPFQKYKHTASFFPSSLQILSCFSSILQTKIVKFYVKIRPLIFLIYTDDILPIVNSESKPIIVNDDHYKSTTGDRFKNRINNAFGELNEWFKLNLQYILTK